MISPVHIALSVTSTPTVATVVTAFTVTIPTRFDTTLLNYQINFKGKKGTEIHQKASHNRNRMSQFRIAVVGGGHDQNKSQCHC